MKPLLFGVVSCFFDFVCHHHYLFISLAVFFRTALFFCHETIYFAVVL